MFTKLANRAVCLYRRHWQRDPFLLEIGRWFRDKGDETLRIDYPLTNGSVVFDVGGYRGDFAAAINKRYGCTVFVFEPVPQFHQALVERFRGNDAVICLNFGLAASEGRFDIAVADDRSSFYVIQGKSARIRAQTKSVSQCILDLGVKTIDLLKINIEGGEFDVIPALIESGDIARVRHLQVQFHRNVEHAAERRLAIRDKLACTHREMWNYEFVWESWALRSCPALTRDSRPSSK